MKALLMFSLIAATCIAAVAQIAEDAPEAESAAGAPAGNLRSLDPTALRDLAERQALTLKTKEVELATLRAETHAAVLSAIEWNLKAHDANESVAVQSAIWPLQEIPVSWENPTPENQEGRERIRQAIRDTWEKECGVRFVGWGPATPSSPGIRIRIEDAGEAPHCKDLGRYLDGVKDGMVLNLTFRNWCSQCSMLPHAAEWVAVHEFGHALGFAHEHNRTDTPEWCKNEHAPQGRSGDLLLSEWDADSIMNYCNKKWNGEGHLSPKDIEAARRLYGEPQP